MLKVKLWIVAKQLPRFTDICIRMLDIARTVGSELRLDRLSERLTEIVINIDQIFPAAVRNIERIKFASMTLSI